MAATQCTPKSFARRTISSRLLRFTFAVAAIALFAYLASRIDEVPYNVRELFLQGRAAASAGLALAFTLVAAAPWLTVSCWRSPRLGVALFSIPLTFGIGTVVYFSLAAVVPEEAVDDLVGTPVLGIGRTLERWLRFAGLLWGLIWSEALGVQLVASAAPLGLRLTRGVLACVGIAGSYIVVVGFACTNNLTELLPQQGSSPAVAAIPAWLAISAGIVALAGGWGRSPKRLLLSSAAVALSFPAGWWLINVGTAHQIEKYGETFSALQFLLSRERSTYLPPSQLFPRFVVVQLALLLSIAIGWCVWPDACRTRSASKNNG